MNRYTEALDAMPVNAVQSVFIEDIDLALRVYTVCEYNIEIHISLEEEWISFWPLFACFLAEVDQETIEAIRAEIIDGNY
jgi:hypothetical protein